MNAVKGFFENIVKFLGKLFKNATWQTTAQAILITVGAAIENVLVLSGDEAAAATIATAINEVKAGFAAISALVAQYDSQVHPTFVAQVTSICNDIVADLGTLLSSGCIKNTTTLANVTKWVTMIITDIKSLLGLIPATATTAPPAPAASVATA